MKRRDFIKGLGAGFAALASIAGGKEAAPVFTPKADSPAWKGATAKIVCFDELGAVTTLPNVDKAVLNDLSLAVSNYYDRMFLAIDNSLEISPGTTQKDFEA